VKNLDKQIEKIWLCRYSQDIEGAKNLWLTLCEQLKITVPAAQNMPKSLGSPEECSLWVVFSSFLRVEKKLEDSELVLFHVEKLRHANKDEIAVQRGLNAMYRGQFRKALDCFHQLDGLDTPHQTMAALNRLLCLESLGLDVQNSVEEFKSQTKRAFYKDLVKDQLAALEARSLYANDRLSEIVVSSNTRLTQAHYFGLWLSELPYVTQLVPTITKEKFAQRYHELHNGSYRLGTILGQSQPSDRIYPRLSDVVDRIYLWAWRWLWDPLQMPFSQIMAELYGLEQSVEALQALPAEDLLKLNNALQWISLFAGAGQHELTQSLGSKKDQFHIPLQKEQQLLTQLFKFKMKPTCSADIEILMGEFFDKHSEPLATSLATFLLPVQYSKALRVNIERFDIQVGKQRLVSEPLVRVIEALTQSPQMSCEAFVRIIFGAVQYDAYTHDKRIANLLQKLKSVTGCTTSVRSGFIYTVSGWDDILIEQTNLHTRQILNCSLWQNWRHRSRSLFANSFKPTTLSQPQSLKVLYGRQEIETALNVSRATAARMLATWVDKGQVKRVGAGRAVQYELSPRLKSEIFKEELV
jgi:tetratricopeptide (TPR) repeat protein